MTISEKNYNDALKKAKEIYDLPTSTIITRNLFEQVFPELKDSEDERIRKEIVQSIKDNVCVIHKDKCLAWLEKQGETENENNLDFTIYYPLKCNGKYECIPYSFYGTLTSFSKDEDLIDFLRNCFYTKKECEEWIEKKCNEVIDCPQNHKDMNHSNGCIVLEDFNGGEGFYKLHLDHLGEKQVKDIEELVRTWNTGSNSINNGNIRACIGMCLTDADEQRFKNHDTNLKECIAWLDKKSETFTQKDVDDAYLKGISDAKNEIEKQCGQKFTDNVEPRFKVGDWVVYNRNDHSREIVQIYDIRDGRYYFTDNAHFSWSIKECDEKSHLWSIQDANDGDVLANKYGAIFINAGISSGGRTLNCHCYLSVQNEFCIEEHKTGSWFYKEEITPATKEQRDLLFQKMKEEGYEWDDGKKELKEIEQNPAWSEEDKKILKRIDNLLYSHCQIHGSEYEELHNWLKSLKPNHWKPSNEQMQALLYALGKGGTYNKEALTKLYNDLKNL